MIGNVTCTFDIKEYERMIILLVIANNKSNPSWIAYDILAQGEHDPNAKTYVIAKNKNILLKVKAR